MLTDADSLLDTLWDNFGLPDAPASRVYRIVTPDGPCMLIAETYRRGMRLDPA